MNFYDMRLQFDRILRTVDDDTFQGFRDDFLNQAWAKISTLFVIPSLKRETTFNAVADQKKYLFPLDYGGTEVMLWYKSSSTGTYRRLDPVSEEVLSLIYERRSNGMGTIQFYDLTQSIGSDLDTKTVTLVNNSATVTCVAAEIVHIGEWVRFDPFVVATVDYNPGVYGYRITAAVANTSYTLDREYRGPAGATTMRVRPSDQQQVIIYGSPTAALADAFSLKYYAMPRVLFNDADVPEWSNAGMAIVYMAMSIGYDYLHHFDPARVWFGRAASGISDLQRRREHAQTLVTDLTIGSVSGRKTGPVGISKSTIYKGR